MFQFSGFAHLSMWLVFNKPGCPIRISTDQFVCANPRSFSQLITSFFASESLGIPHTPLICLCMSFFYLNFTVYSIKKVLFFLSTFCLCFLLQYVNERLFRYIIYLNSWRISESNRWPPACKAGALASWANPPNSVLEFRIRILNF